jgi:DUF4097 and DUF4098 domain-containing protein YvlB
MLVTILALGLVPAPQPMDTTLRLPRGTGVTIEASLEAVILRGTGGDEVTVRRGRARLQGGRLEITSDGQGRLEVTVPRWATATVEAMTGRIEVIDGPQALEIEGVAGAIAVSGGHGRLTISAAAGDVTVAGFNGERLDIEALAGRVSVTDASATVLVESVNSGVRLERIRSASVTARSTNGDIEWIGAIPTDGRYEFESHNGNILLRVPATLDARLRVSSFTGGFDTALPARTPGVGRRDAEPHRGEREFTAIYGGGSATIDITTFNGSVQVQPLGGT